MIKPVRPFLPANRQGIALDALTVLLNLFLFPIFTTRVGDLFDQSFRDNTEAFKTLAVLMFFILCGRLAGLYLKRFPLQARLQKSGQTSFPFYFFVLNVPVFILTAAFVAVLLMAFSADLGFSEANTDGSPKNSQTVSHLVTFTIIILMGLEIYFLYRLSKPLNKKEKQMLAEDDWRFGLKGELLADFGLFAYMAVWQVFYSQTVVLLLTPPSHLAESTGLKIFSVIFLFICFLLFYLSPRTVFLIEDRRYPATWLFILLVFLSSIVWYL
jgi:hypothetical protein